MTTIDIPSLRRLRDAATPGEWVYVLSNVQMRARSQPIVVGVAEIGEHVAGFYGIGKGATMRAEANAAYACAAANAVPALCDRVEKLEAALREALPAYETVRDRLTWQSAKPSHASDAIRPMSEDDALHACELLVAAGLIAPARSTLGDTP